MSDIPNQSDDPSGVDRRRRGRIVGALLALYWLAMLTGTHYPKPGLPRLETQLHIDKVLHFTGYMGLATLLLTSVQVSRRPRSLMRAAIIVGFVIAAYGLFDEITQPYFHRDAEVGDYVADILGCLTGLSLTIFFLHRSRFSQKHADSQ